MAIDEYEQKNRDEVDRLKKWLDVKWPRPHPCPICGDDSWIVSNVGHITEEGLLAPAGRPKQGWPVSPVICANCGYTWFVNAVLSGALEVPTEPPAGPDKAGDR